MSYTKVYQWQPHGSNQHSGGGSAPSAVPKSGKELAKLAGTSERTIEHAKTVLTKGGEDVFKAVEAGKISVKRGSEISKLPKEKQEKAIESPTSLSIESPAEPGPSILNGNVPTDAELEANERANWKLKKAA